MPTCWGAIQQWLRTNPGDLILECDGLGFIDSTGLSLTVRLHNDLTARGHRQFWPASPAVRRPFEVTNLIEVLDVREGAVTSLRIVSCFVITETS